MNDNSTLKTKILWMSNAAWAPTGYGNQTRLVVPRLKNAGYDMAILAFYGLEGGIIEWEGIRCYPKGIHAYGVDVAGADAAHFGAKFLISLIDAWVIEPQAFPNTHWVPWFPVDMEPLPRAVERQVKKAYKRIVFSRFAERMVNNAGLDCYYVPHGVDCNQYRPLEMDTCRDGLKWPKDRFIIGMVAANQGQPSRKAFTQQLEAYSIFKKRHPDAWMYMHTLKGNSPLGQSRQSVNLIEYCGYLGLKVGVLGQCDPNDVDVLFPDEFNLHLGFPQEYMTGIYSAMDVFLLVSMGEGFGIPIVEAQACGCPVIVGDWTAMSELCFSGWKVDKSEAQPWWTPLAASQFSPQVIPIVERLEKAYLAKGRKKFREQAREGALLYDADRVVTEYWKPTLENIIHEIDNPEKMPEMNLVRFN
jgi:glycosyltransferase involved in cell wall biosynthesis